MIHIESVSKFLSELQALGGNKEFFLEEKIESFQSVLLQYIKRNN